MDVLPGVVAPRANAFGEDPAPHRAGRDGRKAGILGNAAGQFGATEAARAAPGTAWASYKPGR